MLIGKKIWLAYTSVRPQACDGHKIFIFSIQENFDLQKMRIRRFQIGNSNSKFYFFGLKIELKYFNESDRSYF